MKSTFESIISLVLPTLILTVTLPGDSHPTLNDRARKMILAVEREPVITRAEKFLNDKPVTVTATLCTRSAGTAHDYYSEGDYWWPDPKNLEGPYIRRDGLSNPENFTAHRSAIGQFSWKVGTFTSAYLLTGEKKYLDAARLHLKAWFIDAETLMSPHLLYAQAIKGVCTGRGIGIIDAIALMEVGQSAAILQWSPYMPVEESNKIKDWFRQFLVWLTTHPYGIEEMNWKNNHGTWWHAQVAVFSTLVGDEKMKQFCRDRFMQILIPNQMAADGSFPFELERTKPYAYSLFNLNGMTALAWVLSNESTDLWNFKTSDGRGLKKAVEYIMPYVADKNKWPFARDVSHWDEQPGRQPFVLFSALAYHREEWLELWKSLDANLQSDEARRNSPLKNPLLWIGLPEPKKP